MASERKGRTIVPDKKKLIIGLIAGALLCGISAVFFSVKAGAALFIGFAVVGAVRLNIQSDRWFRSYGLYGSVRRLCARQRPHR